MKKAAIVILIILIVMAPAVYAQESPAPLDIYMSNDTLLETSIENYDNLLDNRDDRLEMYGRMRVFRRSLLSTAQAGAARENGIIQVDLDIENALVSIKAREAWLEVEFRNTFLNLHELSESAAEALEKSNDADDDYMAAKSSYASGFISRNSLLSSEYASVSAYNSYLARKRQYESALRSFNLKMGNRLDYDEYDFSFVEEIIELGELSEYMKSALENSPSLVNYEQKLDAYAVEKKHYEMYSLSENLTDVREAFELLDVNIKLAELEYKRLLESTETKVIESFKALETERSYLDLYAYNIDILLYQYELNKGLYNKGYVDKEDLSDSYESIEDARFDYIKSVYSYNTNLKSFEYDCAFYTEESDGE